MKPITVFEDKIQLVNYASDNTTDLFSVLSRSNRYAIKEKCQTLNQILCQHFKERYNSLLGMLESDLSDDIHFEECPRNPSSILFESDLSEDIYTLKSVQKSFVRGIPRFVEQEWNAIPFLHSKNDKILIVFKLSVFILSTCFDVELIILNAFLSSLTVYEADVTRVTKATMYYKSDY